VQTRVRQVGMQLLVLDGIALLLAVLRGRNGTSSGGRWMRTFWCESDDVSFGRSNIFARTTRANPGILTNQKSANLLNSTSRLTVIQKKTSDCHNDASGTDSNETGFETSRMDVCKDSIDAYSESG
jgi:hypothetical protein